LLTLSQVCSNFGAEEDQFVSGRKEGLSTKSQIQDHVGGCGWGGRRERKPHMRKPSLFERRASMAVTFDTSGGYEILLKGKKKTSLSLSLSS